MYDDHFQSSHNLHEPFMRAPSTLERYDMKRIFVALIVPILVISLSSLGVSHFAQNTEVRYALHYAAVDVGFVTYDYENTTASSAYAPDDHTLQISTQVSPGWNCWIGFILQNFGTIYGANVSVPIYTVTSDGQSVSDFIHTEYFYGPWTENNVPSNVYGAVSPPPSGNVSSPLYLQPSGGSNSVNSMVLWIEVQYPINAPYLSNPIQLTIAITATSSPAISTISSQTWP
jgi:hypothetical protein